MQDFSLGQTEEEEEKIRAWKQAQVRNRYIQT
jgi:hypothetical protein